MSKPASLFEAVVAVQSELPTLGKDRTVKVKTKTGGEYSYSYTPLDTIVEKVEPLLAKNDLAWITKPGYNSEYGPSLKYKLAHAPSQETEEGEMPLMLAENDAQGMGSAITYMRRYALCAVLNIVADADDDGALAGGNGGRSTVQQNSRPATEKQTDYAKKLLKQKKLLTVAQIKPVLVYAGVPEPLASDPAAAMDQLTGAWASNIIDVLTKGPVPTGASDVPPAADGEFTHAPAGEELFDPSVAQ